MDQQINKQQQFIFQEENDQQHHDTELGIQKPKTYGNLLNNLELVPTKIVSKNGSHENQHQQQQSSGLYNNSSASINNINIPDVGKKKKTHLPPINRFENNSQLKRGLQQISQKPFVPEEDSQYDIHKKLQKQKIAYKSIKVVTEIRSFVETPIPKDFKLSCIIKKSKSKLFNFYPQYDLYLNNNQQIYLMSAKRIPCNITSTYIISLNKTQFVQKSTYILAKLKSNFSGTTFVMTNQKITQQVSSQILTVNYTFACCTQAKPRQMNVVLRNQSTKSTNNSQINDMETQAIQLTSKKPRWDEKRKIYQMNFEKKVKKASVKNFILIQQNDLSQQNIMLFGKTEKATFIMQIINPLTPLQAFGIALSSCDSKLIVQ